VFITENCWILKPRKNEQKKERKKKLCVFMVGVTPGGSTKKNTLRVGSCEQEEKMTCHCEGRDQEVRSMYRRTTESGEAEVEKNGAGKKGLEKFKRWLGRGQLCRSRQKANGAGKGGRR